WTDEWPGEWPEDPDDVAGPPAAGLVVSLSASAMASRALRGSTATIAHRSACHRSITRTSQPGADSIGFGRRRHGLGSSMGFQAPYYPPAKEPGHDRKAGFGG